MPESRRLLRRAAAIYDDPVVPLAAAAAAAYDFSTGANWMHAALSHLRGTSLPAPRAGFQRAGILKYIAASGAAVAPVIVAAVTAKWYLAILAIPCFYAVEVQMLFLFPLMLDRHARPLRQSLRLTRRAGGTMHAVATVLPIAAVMLFGVFFGGGLRRTWCIGCLAVCLWYEKVRRQLPHIRRESFAGMRLKLPVRLLFASDLHLGRPWTRRAAADLLRAARFTRPQLVLLGGDLIDTLRGMRDLRRVMIRLASRCPVYATSGNHDLRFPDIRSVARDAGVHWLPDEASIFLTPGGEAITLADPARPAPGKTDILCSHDPRAVATASSPLAFAGHLHGGQCILATVNGKLFPGYWFNRLTVLRRVTQETTLFVSRGLADTLPLRFNCPREVILCEIS